MRRNTTITNAILWAAALIASAFLGAPSELTLGLLPLLATVSLIATARGAGRENCET